MEITAKLWDKETKINGQTPEILKEHFKKQNGSDERILIFFDGSLERIQNVDDSQFSNEERTYMQSLIATGTTHDQAIADTWRQKIKSEEERNLKESENKISLEQQVTDLQMALCEMYERLV